MKAEKFTLSQLNEYCLKLRLSQFKIELVMKQRPASRSRYYFYGAESATMARIVRRRLPEVSFNGQKGLQNCMAIEQRLRGQYRTATIYQRPPGGQWATVATYAEGLAPVVQLHQPAKVVHMRVVHNALEQSITFIPNQLQAA